MGDKKLRKQKLFIDTNKLDPEIYMEKTNIPIEDQEDDVQDSDEEDYAISVTAIMQRRASTRGVRGYKSPRRASSPMGHMIQIGNFNERRRSSVYTTSSGE